MTDVKKVNRRGDFGISVSDEGEVYIVLFRGNTIARAIKVDSKQAVMIAGLVLNAALAADESARQ